MNYPPVSGCFFVKDAFIGAFCPFESLASVLPFVSDVTVMDLGSTDGTRERLQQIADANPRVRLVDGQFPVVDAGAFATLANDLIAMCPNEAVWYWQADEVPHENLLGLVEQRFAAGEFDLAFWRIQYRENFRVVKWFPQVVHRVGRKGRFNFVGDGMNTDRYMEPPMCSDYGREYFMQWGDMGQEGVKPYVDQMLLDVSLVGAFLENIPGRRRLHSPFWHEEPTIEGMAASDWMARERQNPNWTKKESPYNLPAIMRWHVGRPKYELRESLFRALCEDTTRELLGV